MVASSTDTNGRMSPAVAGIDPFEENRLNTARLRQLNDTKGVEGNLFTFLYLVFLSEKDENERRLDEEERNTIAEALGIDGDVLHKAFADLFSGNASVGQAVEGVFSRINPQTANLAQADRAFSSFNGLSNLPPSTNANFLQAVNFTLKLEGGWNPNEPDGGVANFGINSNANPDIDVRNLTRSGAVQLYETRYWDAVKGIDNMDQRAAMAVFDCAVNCGAGRANKFLNQLESEGKYNRETGQLDVAAFMAKRAQFNDYLVSSNPAKYAQYESGWDKRLDHLATVIESLPAAQTQLASSFVAAREATSPLQTDTKQPVPATAAFGNGEGVDQIAKAAELDTSADVENGDLNLTKTAALKV